MMTVSASNSSSKAPNVEFVAVLCLRLGACPGTASDCCFVAAKAKCSSDEHSDQTGTKNTGVAKTAATKMCSWILLPFSPTSRQTKNTGVAKTAAVTKMCSWPSSLFQPHLATYDPGNVAGNNKIGFVNACHWPCKMAPNVCVWKEFIW